MFESFDINKDADAFVLTKPQHYLHSDPSDLVTEKKQVNRSDLIPTTLPIPSEKERLLLARKGLLERRAQVYNSWFLSFRKSKIEEIREIDEQVDQLEEQLIAMQNDEHENMVAYSQKIISDADALIDRINV